MEVRTQRRNGNRLSRHLRSHREVDRKGQGHWRFFRFCGTVVRLDPLGDYLAGPPDGNS